MRIAQIKTKNISVHCHFGQVRSFIECATPKRIVRADYLRKRERREQMARVYCGKFRKGRLTPTRIEVNLFYLRNLFCIQWGYSTVYAVIAQSAERPSRKRETWVQIPLMAFGAKQHSQKIQPELTIVDTVSSNGIKKTVRRGYTLAVYCEKFNRIDRGLNQDAQWISQRCARELSVRDVPLTVLSGENKNLRKVRHLLQGAL